MKSNISSKAILIALLIFTASCKTRKVVSLPASPVESGKTELNAKAAENIKMLKSKDIQFKTMSIKAKAKIGIGENKNNANMNIRMDKGRQIWVSITAFAGIEAARAVITPDSIKVRNNLQGVYLKKPFSFIYRYANRQITYDWLEAILAGNTIPALVSDRPLITEEAGSWTLTGDKQSLAFKVIFDALLKVKETTINDSRNSQALKVVYSGKHLNLGADLIPNALSIESMVGTKRVNIELEYISADRNINLEFPFTVPSKYEIVN